MGFHEWIIYPSIYIGLIAISFYILTYTTARKEKKSLFTDDELPFASVVIPAFNEGKSVEDTIKSILSSEYPGGFEVIVVDDGSNDDTYMRAKKYEKNKGKNPDFEVIGVEVKKNGYLDKEEKLRCKWYLDKGIFPKIYIAKGKRGKEDKRQTFIEYEDFEKEYLDENKEICKKKSKKPKNKNKRE